MTTKDEALKLALEALELHLTHHEHGCVYLDPAVTAIKEALAQPEQEPVGLIESLKDAKPCCGEYETCWRACTPRGKFLGQRDAQRTWVGLTDEDIDIAFDDTQEGGGFWEFARAIEAKLKQKNGYAEEKNP